MEPQFLGLLTHVALASDPHIEAMYESMKERHRGGRYARRMMRAIANTTRSKSDVFSRSCARPDRVIV